MTEVAHYIRYMHSLGFSYCNVYWSHTVLELISDGVAICHKSWVVRGYLSLSPSILLSSLPSRGLPTGSGQSPLTRCQTFWCNLCFQRFRQPNKLHWRL